MTFCPLVMIAALSEPNTRFKYVSGTQARAGLSREDAKAFVNCSLLTHSGAVPFRTPCGMVNDGAARIRRKVLESNVIFQNPPSHLCSP